MQGYLAALTIVLLIGMVVTRLFLMRKAGTRAMHFGNIDKTDYLIPPFALFYFYTVFAAAFDFPILSTQTFFQSEVMSWVVVLLCLEGLVLFVLRLGSLGKNFRGGIHIDRPDRLVTTGVFAVPRNPIYVAFGFILLGEFFVFPNWIMLLYPVGGIWLFHRQVRREEGFLRMHYGQEYAEYCSRVKRYL